MKLSKFSEKFSDVMIAEGIYFQDERGSLKKTMYSSKLLEIMGNISEVLCSTSSKDVIRGMHFQNKPKEISKFITCTEGRILDVFLDVRKDSKTFGEFDSILLSASDDKAIFIPEGFAHGYGVLSNKASIVYLQSGDYSEEHDFSIHPLSIGIDWEVSTPKLSEKDISAVTFDQYVSTLTN
jgi:dTDP-4-dehydrorhamnose 3,5-epimerase